MFSNCRLKDETDILNLRKIGKGFHKLAAAFIIYILQLQIPLLFLCRFCCPGLTRYHCGEIQIHLRIRRGSIPDQSVSLPVLSDSSLSDTRTHAPAYAHTYNNIQQIVVDAESCINQYQPVYSQNYCIYTLCTSISTDRQTDRQTCTHAHTAAANTCTNTQSYIITTQPHICIN